MMVIADMTVGHWLYCETNITIILSKMAIADMTVCHWLYIR